MKILLTLHWHSMKPLNRIYWLHRIWQNLVIFLLGDLVFKVKPVRNMIESPLLFRNFIVLFRLQSPVLCVQFVTKPSYIFVTNFQILLFIYQIKILALWRERISGSANIGHKMTAKAGRIDFIYLGFPPGSSQIPHWYLQKRYLLIFYLSRILI